METDVASVSQGLIKLRRQLHEMEVHFIYMAWWIEDFISNEKHKGGDELNIQLNFWRYIRFLIMPLRFYFGLWKKQ